MLRDRGRLFIALFFENRRPLILVEGLVIFLLRNDPFVQQESQCRILLGLCQGTSCR
jgi:hypothetical protein